MKVNEATWDRVLRVIVGLFLLSFLIWMEGNSKYWGLIGLLPLITGLVGYCPAYSLFKVSTRKES
ncbi:Protein of unknown function (DUF2892) [Candidatus Kryptonium thompsonii]|jgi:hypothetical protein|uniref:YgaP family membrane protein n=1 Tax=Candidatus Kryptonium thompsonii TaxID=1633631 RepID=UPI00063ECCB9|nr:DUF2892 domain-containing protein [Candidatus Kryptonium thompsoni]CUS78730.1 Protein of unknown function (DUF2892) [Candidatus Kryptonium thompsoni]CUS86406.1 Protein of unknown function (DUF2892) [Candidatus Kryptonium thompsoni]CUS88166.1 Protein of unknown function (DUF2892) [Candidatus Kryptonium thompsoni]CUS89531.1 Protein of unknown function (DUF2892) [Candidatus Kryptonium thompsoni]CUT01666.1 Protein of unknown function (DUF2892) [Candidatus Kryptonium thompsoni]